MLKWRGVPLLQSEQRGISQILKPTQPFHTTFSLAVEDGKCSVASHSQWKEKKSPELSAAPQAIWDKATIGITQRGTHVPGVHDRPVSSHTDAIHLLLCSCQPPSSNFGLTLTVDDILRPRWGCKLRLQLLEEESEAGAWAHYTAITK